MADVQTVVLRTGGMGDSRTWDTPTREIVLSAGGYGPGPTLIMCDRFSGLTNASDIPLAPLSIIGKVWSSKEAGIVIQEFDGRPCLKSKYSGTTKSIRVANLPQFSEYFLSYGVGVPAGSTFSGSTLEESFVSADNGSTWKFAWLSKTEAGTASDDSLADVCVPSKNGNTTLIVGGNSISPVSVASIGGTDWRTLWSWNKLNKISVYQKPDPTSKAGVNGITEFVWCNGTTTKTQVTAGATMAQLSGNTATDEELYYNWVQIPGWMGNGDQSNSQGLYSDIYLSIGDNARARIELTDSATYESSTKRYIVPPAKPSDWTDAKIRFTPEAHENLQYIHIYKADGTRMPAVVNPKYGV